MSCLHASTACLLGIVGKDDRGERATISVTAIGDEATAIVPDAPESILRQPM
jgi:hypothetical protein